jgi:hypothetical protein
VTPPAGLKRSLDGSGCLRLGKGPIVEKHTPSLERSRGGGKCGNISTLAKRLSFCGFTSRRSLGNRGVSRLFRLAAPFSVVSVAVL